MLNTLDALLGSPVLSDTAFGGNIGSGASASLFDTSVNATCQLTVNAVADATLTSTITNTTEAAVSQTGTSLKGGQSLALGAVLSMNKVSSKATASIDYGPSFVHSTTTADVQADNGVEVTAGDTANITATITLGTSTDTSSTGVG